MKKNIIILLMLSSLISFSQGELIKNTLLHEIMTDSLFKSMNNFCDVVIEDFTKQKVTKKNVENFIDYISKNSADVVQSVNFLNPQKTKKDSMIEYMREDLMTLVGSNIVFQYISWDGWDGKTPYVMFRFDLKHEDYDKQFLVIIDTKNKIHTIFSVNSK